MIGPGPYCRSQLDCTAPRRKRRNVLVHGRHRGRCGGPPGNHDIGFSQEQRRRESGQHGAPSTPESPVRRAQALGREHRQREVDELWCIGPESGTGSIRAHAPSAPNGLSAERSGRTSREEDRAPAPAATTPRTMKNRLRRQGGIAVRSDTIAPMTARTNESIRGTRSARPRSISGP